MVEYLTCNEWLIDMEQLDWKQQVWFGGVYLILFCFWLVPLLVWQRSEFSQNKRELTICIDALFVLVHLWVFVGIIFTLCLKRISPLVSNYHFLHSLLKHGHSRVCVHLNMNMEWNEVCLWHMCEYLFRKQSLVFSNTEIALLFVFIWAALSTFFFVIQLHFIQLTQKSPQNLPCFFLTVGCFTLSNGCIIFLIQKLKEIIKCRNPNFHFKLKPTLQVLKFFNFYPSLPRKKKKLYGLKFEIVFGLWLCALMSAVGIGMVIAYTTNLGALNVF
ncbi:hypothetical protein RFI_23637 [Reticulomyxa filosa]|uniref:Uncharacterized protein n=1 Tax=Reticulomyxa filosa TaxID=46433 RepID=X6MJU8_RETFI|nr:hypothetical protein RFI_23637 [Reticulomyxa filosa]|eukprot:ETO13732.1 hypothetical protein RFI_23637 [Reticulomyxa filosa]